MAPQEAKWSADEISKGTLTAKQCPASLHSLILSNKHLLLLKTQIEGKALQEDFWAQDKQDLSIKEHGGKWVFFLIHVTLRWRT